MKKLVLSVVVLAMLVVSGVTQNVLVRFYKGNPNFPDGWPSDTRFVSFSDLVPPGWDTNFTEQEYILYRFGLEPQFRSIQQTKQDAAEDQRRQKLLRLGNAFNAIATFEQDWANEVVYTQAQLLTVIKTHNRALHELRPLLADLYRASLQE